MTLFEIGLLLTFVCVALAVIAALICAVAHLSDLADAVRRKRIVINHCHHVHVHKGGAVEVGEGDGWKRGETIFDADDPSEGGGSTFIHPKGGPL